MSLQQELRKKNPFDSPEQEAHLNLVRTTVMLGGAFERLFKAHGLSGATYNVLRILRGSQPHGRPCHEIGEDLVAGVPDVTRLIDRLEKAGLAQRVRCPKDRRVIWIQITKEGLKLLDKLDRPTLDLHRSQLGHLGKRKLKELSELLEEARGGARDN
jgi:DNA-binding MarR family transcriptional regulator